MKVPMTISLFQEKDYCHIILTLVGALDGRLSSDELLELLIANFFEGAFGPPEFEGTTGL